MSGFDKATSGVSKVKETREKARTHFSRKEVRRAWLNRSVVAVVILIAIIWGGFRVLPAFHNIFNLPNFIDAIIILALLAIIVNNYSSFGEFDEYRTNVMLQKEIDEYDEKQATIKDYIKFGKQTRQYNKVRYELESINLRMDKIDDYKAKLADAIIKEKVAKEKRLRNKIKRLEFKKEGQYVNPVKVKKFKPYTWQQFLTPTSDHKADKIGIDYKSKSMVRKSLNRMNVIRVLLLIAFRASVAAAFDESWERFFIFVGIVVFGAFFSAVFSYEWTRDDIANNEVKAIKAKRQELQKILNIELEGDDLVSVSRNEGGGFERETFCTL